jgi:hypothetical protein
MNQSKFSLADVITILTALWFSFICFLGINFYSLGNTKQSIILSAIIFISLCSTTLGAKLLKRTSRNFKICFIWEVILLILFTGFMLFFSYSPFPHYFVVSDKKADIQKKLTAGIIQAENMFTEYERYAKIRENLYKSKLRSVANAKAINPSKYAEYGFKNNGIADSKQIDNKTFTLHADLFPTNYSDTISDKGIKEVATGWLIDAKSKVNTWKPISILNVVNNVENESKNWLNTLVELSSVREKGEQAENFVYPLSFDSVKKNFETLGKPSPISIGLSVLAYVLMLLSWFVAKRSTKSTGMSTAPYEVKL